MQKAAVRIGPRDNGRPMSLEEFDRAEATEGHLYELSRGVVVVSDVPDPRHFAQVEAIRDQFILYKAGHPGQIHRVGGGAECKLLIVDYQSERHPDVAVYKTPPPAGANLWASWVPEIVIEVISPGSEQRDYVEKREEYLRFGVREYWICDAARQEVLVLRRSGKRWTERVVSPPEVYRTRLLPGFALDCAAVFREAEAAGG